ncbi:hypothetical protein K2224_17985 [Streptomyces sp. BHT-5-2]|uniref:hypothetical protein n=1 Tax=Streptomyces sp. BHT-5-2 TaxID=2866715 RepID=UPI001C8DC50A|nr:hypothetical protein [Streptomyces sp. BHT-5-2]QZL04800.1 hypothetical protein K2224_17985 [Streptomyces sp. BHT-5-2]
MGPPTPGLPRHRGGTLNAAARLVAQSAAHITGLAVVVELSGLGGAEQLSAHRLLTLCEVGQ